MLEQAQLLSEVELYSVEDTISDYLELRASVSGGTGALVITRELLASPCVSLESCECVAKLTKVSPSQPLTCADSAHRALARTTVIVRSTALARAVC